MTLAQIKALFKTGAIPTQADFENLIDKIPNNDKLGRGDNTLNFVDPSNVNVLGYRFVTIGDEASYLFIGFYDAANATYLPYIIVHCNTGSPSEYGNTPPVKYTILTSELMTKMLQNGGELYSTSDEVLVGAIPSTAKWNWVGWYYLSNTHRVIKNELVEEHFFVTTDGSTRAYFKIVYAAENDTFPIVSEAIRIGVSGGAITTYNYILTSIANMNDYKKELYAILDSTDLRTTQLLSFINKYMRDINVTKKKPSIVTIMYTGSDNISYVYNCIMGMGNIDSIVPICIHSLVKVPDVENDDVYAGAMSILQRTTYNYMIVKSEWKKIMELQGYEDGLVIDNSGVAENFMNSVHANCYRQIQLR